jgi:hypothetical protein
MGSDTCLAMSIAEIEQAIERLPREELFELTSWISQRFGDAWDRQIEEDIQAGRLNEIAKDAVAEFRNGQTVPFPEDAK